MCVLNLLYIVLLFYIGQVNSIGRNAAKLIQQAMTSHAKQITNLLKITVTGDTRAREEFTRRFIATMVKKYPRYNYLVTRDYIWKKLGVKKYYGLIATRHIEVKAFFGIKTYGYKVAAYNRRTFSYIRIYGRNGDKYWKYGGTWNRRGNVIKYFPPRSPPLHKLLKKCVNVFSPNTYRYISKHSNTYKSQFAIQPIPAVHGRFYLTRRHGREYLYNSASKGYIQCGKEHFALRISRVHRNWSPECFKSNNCYSIQVYDVGTYYSAKNNGQFLCDKKRVTRSEVFIIEPCGLFN